ncbi:MAG: hypothetical protein NT067_00450 [Candidatus Diapherotrites archaeon]|nr:hypothetical protein [Candidatus Diapherotrites archaeon]
MGLRKRFEKGPRQLTKAQMAKAKRRGILAGDDVKGITWHGAAFSRTQSVPGVGEYGPRRYRFERWDGEGILNAKSTARDIRVGPVKGTSVDIDLDSRGRVERSQRVITVHTPRKEVRIQTDRRPGKNFSLTVATKPKQRKGESIGQYIYRADREYRTRTFTSKRGRRTE